MPAMSVRLACLTACLATAGAAAPPPQPWPHPQLPEGRSTSAGVQPAHLVWTEGTTSYCLSSDGNRIGDGVKIQLWECDQTWQSTGQNFYLDMQDEEGRIRMHQDPSYCAVIDGDKYSDGAQIQLWRCSAANLNQTWRFSFSGQIAAAYAPREMCVAIDGNKAFNGAKIQAWSCLPYQPGGGVQDWLQLSLAKGGNVAYAVPKEDKACTSPFAPVGESMEACVAAAEALRPGAGCRTPVGSIVPWSQVAQKVDEPSWPLGCSFYGACQGGCSLDFNPSGTGASCPTQGECMSISNICQMPVPSTSTFTI